MHKRKHFRRGILGDTISYTYLTILALLAAFPLFWILVSSVKSKGELTANPTAIFPQVFSLEYYKIVFEQLKFGTNIMNSVVVAGSTTIISSCWNLETAPTLLWNTALPSTIRSIMC